MTLGAIISMLLLSLTARAYLMRDSDDDIARVATGQYVSPIAPPDSVQLSLNPGLALYPNFIAGEAVRSRLSPDGTTLSVLTAGQNSLYRTNGTVDTAASTQFLFLYDVTGAHKATPALKQVIQQRNSHVGLVWAPDGETLYAAGGSDDLVYVYTKSGSQFVAAPPINLGHVPAGAPNRNFGVGLGVQPNASGLDISADGHTLVIANNTTIRSA